MTWTTACPGLSGFGYVIAPVITAQAGEMTGVHHARSAMAEVSETIQGRPVAKLSREKIVGARFRDVEIYRQKGLISEEDWEWYCYVFRDSTFRFSDIGKGAAARYAARRGIDLPMTDNNKKHACDGPKNTLNKSIEK